MQDFRKLRVWEKSHQMALEIYRRTGSFPDSEMYSMTSQMRRAAVSIPANIAEGCGRSSSADFGRFLHIALGSACELEYFLILARDLEYLEPSAYDNVSETLIAIKQMISALLSRIRNSDEDRILKPTTDN
jgi:four helix bundle protein